MGRRKRHASGKYCGKGSSTNPMRDTSATNGHASPDKRHGKAKPKKAAVDMLDAKLAASKEVFSRRIAFVPGKTEPWLKPAALPKEAIVCNPAAVAEAAAGAAKAQQDTNGAGPAVVDGVVVPKRRLHNPDRLRLQWISGGTPVGAGLKNIGNTCFMNSVLQCLTYTAPWFHALDESNHIARCQKSGFCVMCELIRHMRTAISRHRRVAVPQVIFHKLRTIAKHFRPGRQEDAHEFMRYLVDGVHEVCLRGHEKLDIHTQRTTIVYSVFGGLLQNAIICTRCKHSSVTHDATLDLNLDLTKCTTLKKALQRFTAPEKLTRDNSYKCDGCKHMVKAIKQLTIHRAPMVLTIQLKRFDIMSGFGGKINKFVEYPEILDLKPYMSGQKDQSHLYELHAVLVHAGFSLHSGHYYCFIKAPNKMWHRMDDSAVSTVKLSTVLKQQAYILFYTRKTPVVLQEQSQSTHAPKATKKPEMPATEPKGNKESPPNDPTPTEHVPSERLSSVVGAIPTAAADSDDEDTPSSVAAPVPTTQNMPVSLPLRPVVPPQLVNAERDSAQVMRTLFATDRGWRVDAKIVPESPSAEVQSGHVKPLRINGESRSDEKRPHDLSEDSSISEESSQSSGNNSSDSSSGSEVEAPSSSPTHAGIDARQKRKKRPAPVIEWDHGIGEKTKGGGTAFTWDGKRRKADAVLEYMKSDSVLGYQVHSWTGDANIVDAVAEDKQIDTEEEEYARQRAADEEELDRGRVKKVKSKDPTKATTPKDLSKSFQRAYEKKIENHNSQQAGGYGRGKGRSGGRGGRGRGRGRGGRGRGGIGKKLTLKKFS